MMEIETAAAAKCPREKASKYIALANQRTSNDRMPRNPTLMSRSGPGPAVRTQVGAGGARNGTLAIGNCSAIERSISIDTGLGEVAARLIWGP